jgi:hypothetical protein
LLPELIVPKDSVAITLRDSSAAKVVMTNRYVEERNRPLFDLPDAHPAKRFLLAFIACREQCVGRESDWNGQTPIEQAWLSQVDGKQRTFSAFAYQYLAFDVELDGYLTAAPHLTESEEGALRGFPHVRSLMSECSAAARAADNRPMLELVSQVLGMLELWERAIRYRESEIATGS